MLSSRSANENCTKDSDSHTKWAPFDVIELKENSDVVDGITQANELQNYSEKNDHKFLPEKDA